MKCLPTTLLTLVLTLLFSLQAVAIPTSDVADSTLQLDLTSDFIYRDPDTGALIPMNGTVEVRPLPSWFKVNVTNKE